MKVSIRTAVDADADAIARVRSAAADQLTTSHGRGHWSTRTTVRTVLRELQQSHTLVGVVRGIVFATVRLETRKPWAIDVSCFASVPRVLYLHGMAVDPALQRRGVGAQLLGQAKAVAQCWPSDAIRLDTYDSAAGAKDFYLRCGFHEVGRAVCRRVPLVYLEMLLESAA